MRRAILVLLCLGLLAMPAAASQTAFLPVILNSPIEPAYVIHIVDGDTIDVQIGSTIRRVRYIGMDTPESGDCYAAQATARNSELVYQRYVRLVKDVSETDRYGRLLRYVYVGETFVNAELVRGGYALVYTVPPDVAHAAEFLALEQEARAAGRGLWSACATPTPTATLWPTPTATPQATATWTPQPTPTWTPWPTLTPTTEGGGTVYITETGSKYHRWGCRYLSHGATAVSCAYATSHGYTACSVCDPWCP